MKRQQGMGETEGQGSCRRARQTQDPRMVGGRGTVGKRKDVRGGLRDKDDEEVVAGKQEELELGLPLPFPAPHRSAAMGTLARTGLPSLYLVSLLHGAGTGRW